MHAYGILLAQCHFDLSKIFHIMSSSLRSTSKKEYDLVVQI